MSRERGRGEKTERQLFAETESRDGKQERAAGEVTVKQTVANKSSNSETVYFLLNQEFGHPRPSNS